MRILLTLLLLAPSFLNAQLGYSTKELDPFVFYNYQRNCFTIIDDSTGCHEYNPIKKQWETRKLKMILDEPFSLFLKKFLVLHEKNSEIFFVDRGCGQVYIMKNDSIYRHDHSFHHQNQFGGLFFIYNNEPHIFGGYGLFSSKNIITRYSLEEREWYHYEIKGDAPKPRKNTRGKIVNGKLYIVGGFCPANDMQKSYFDFWVFDFTKLTWTNRGNIIKIPVSVCEKDDGLITFSEEYCVSESFIYKFNFAKNKVDLFKNIMASKLKAIFTVNNLSLIYKINHNSDFCEFEIVENYKLAPYASVLLFEKPESNSSRSLIIFIISSVCIILFVLIQLLKSRSKRKVKTISHSFDPMELKLLALFFENESQGIEISLINDIVNQDNPSIDTLKKRRENLVRELKSKISKDCKIPVEMVLIEEKNAIDKRIKIMKLNPVVLKRYARLFNAN